MPLTPSDAGCSVSRNSVITSASGTAPGDEPQDAVVVEPLDGGEIEGERLVQLVDDQLRQLLDLALGAASIAVSLAASRSCSRR